MEHFEIAKTEEGLHVEGFPDAVKLLKLDGPKSKRLADLSLHKTDLDFALQCLEQINEVPQEPYILRQALWRSAVVHYIKCFGGNESRFSLVITQVYNKDEGATEAFEYFKNLRNKHFVHDENSYSQCLPAAVLNKKEMDHKIAKIVCLSVTGDTLTQGNYSNLHLLVTLAHKWVVTQFDQLCDHLTEDLESEQYEALLSRDSVTYTGPKVEEIHERRNTL